MIPPLVWLDGDETPASTVVGARGWALARLAQGGLPVPRAFALGTGHFAVYVAPAPSEERTDDLWLAVPAALRTAIEQGLAELGAAVALRASPLGPGAGQGKVPESGLGDLARTHLAARAAGRPHRETYVYLADAAEVVEAVRRLWIPAAKAGGPAAMGIVVQRFVPSEACARVKRDPSDPTVLTVEAALGVGDLLAAGLVVADRYRVRAADGATLLTRVGRKAQMSRPREGGGLSRFPVPSDRGGRPALTEAQLAEAAALFRNAEGLLGPVSHLALAFAVAAGPAGHAAVTSVAPVPAALAPREAGFLLG